MPTEPTPTDTEPLGGFSAPLRADLAADQPPAPRAGDEQESRSLPHGRPTEREDSNADSTGRAA